jgi:glutamine amidotransferase
VILPGVGAFGEAMKRLENYQLIEVIQEVADSGKPFLGICLGLQLMFESSDEAPGVAGLGILRGRILRIPDNGELKIPHMGWNSLRFMKGTRLFSSIPEGSYVYFVHSYYLEAEKEEDVAAVTEYGITIHAAVEKNNIYACQFHPEKSGEIGLKILKNFAEI